eukprot:jgi/Mesen1/5072/ME000252S04181
MFPGLVDPEMMRMAQEQMSRMSPEDIQRMQQMMTPDMIQLATQNMASMAPDDMRRAMSQMQSLPPEQLAQMSQHMGQPERVQQAASLLRQRILYEFNAAMSLKNELVVAAAAAVLPAVGSLLHLPQGRASAALMSSLLGSALRSGLGLGNRLHGQGKYEEAAERYLRAKANLAAQGSPEARALQRTCGVNLMSCYLKTRDFLQAAAQGSEVLKDDPSNVKALFRRGQAYQHLHRLQPAVEDLRRAAELSPDDDTLASVLRQVEEQLALAGPSSEGAPADKGGEVAAARVADGDAGAAEPHLHHAGASATSSSAARAPVAPMASFPGMPGSLDAAAGGEADLMQRQLEMLKENPAALKSMQSMMSNLAPEQVAALSGGKVSADMARAAASMMKDMSADDLDRMLQLSASMQASTAAAPSSFASSAPSGPSSSNFLGRDAAHTPAGAAISASGAATGGAAAATAATAAAGGGSFATGQAAQAHRGASGSEEGGAGSSVVGGEAAATPFPGMPLGMPPGMMPAMTPEMRSQMMAQMSSPAMMEMMKSMSPESMAQMSQQMGMSMTPEQARQAQQAMAGLTPGQMSSLLVWAQRGNSAMEAGRAARDWALRHKGLVLALLALLVAALLQYFEVFTS